MESEENRKKAFERVKKHAIKTLQLSLDKVVEFGKESRIKHFSGEYTEDMEQYYQEIKDGLDAGKMVFAGSVKMEEGEDGTGASGEVMEEGVADQHLYAILECGEFDYNGKKLRMLKLRNPWAGYVPQYRVNEKGQVEPEQNKGKTNGVFWMELAHFTAEFRRYDII